MPVFEIEQYEIHAHKYQVEATSAAEAVQKLFAGGAKPVNDGIDFIGVCNDLGLPVQYYPDLANQLRSLGVTVETAVIPSVRSIGEVKLGDFLGYGFGNGTALPDLDVEPKYQAPEPIDSSFGACSPSKPSANARRRPWKAPRPPAGSTGALRIFSGVRAATSSISTPPSAQAISTGTPRARSTTMPR